MEDASTEAFLGTTWFLHQDLGSLLTTDRESCLGGSLLWLVAETRTLDDHDEFLDHAILQSLPGRIKHRWDSAECRAVALQRVSGPLLYVLASRVSSPGFHMFVQIESH